MSLLRSPIRLELCLELHKYDARRKWLDEDNTVSDPVQAKTIQAFLILLISSQHEDAAALLPVTNMDASFLLSTMKDLIGAS
jgi:hypothetical protein